MFACCHLYFRLQLPLIIIHITCILISLCRTSAPIHLTSVLGVLGTQETSCILIAGLLERDIFDLYLPEFDKPWVIHSREASLQPKNNQTPLPHPSETSTRPVPVPVPTPTPLFPPPSPPPPQREIPLATR